VSDAEEQKPHPLREIVQPFIDAARAPRALWGNNLQYFLEGFLYFGIINYLVIYCVEDLQLSELHAGWVVTVLAGGITFSQFLFGGLVDRWGTRRGLLIALALLAIGRAVLSASGTLGLTGGGLTSPAFLTLMAGIVIVLLGYGLYEPASYTLVRQVTTPKTAAMGFAMLYALMNLGGWLPTFLSPVRRAVGIAGVYWIFTGLTVITLIITAVILTKRTLGTAIAEASAARAGGSEPPDTGGAPSPERIVPTAVSRREAFVDWLRNHPLTDLRFTFFICALIPVQTLFAHNWLTLPLYVSRAYKGTWIGENYEVAVNFNPLLIFVLVPIVAAATRNTSVYKLMIVGTLVMSAPTFLLVLGPSIWTLAGYLVIMTLGEAIWQPRFLQYATEIAPEGRTGAYLGVARLPWFLTKLITGLYSGWFLSRYCPAEGELNTETMWFIYGLIAISSTVMLAIAGRWMRKSFASRT
jgi:MFS family permease